MAGEIFVQSYGETCPKCKSTDVSLEAVGIEFTKITCNACGYMDVADVWDRAEWYPVAPEDKRER